MISPRNFPGAMAVALVVLAAGGAAPSTASAEKYDLRTCAILALRNTLQTEAARADVKAAQADITGARSGFLPRLDLSGNWIRSEDERSYDIGGQFVRSDKSVTGSASVS